MRSRQMRQARTRGSAGKKVMAFSCFGPVHEMTRARIITDLGPRLVELRDRVRNALGEF